MSILSVSRWPLKLKPAIDHCCRVSGLKPKRMLIFLNAELVHDLWKVFTKHRAMIIKGQSERERQRLGVGWKPMKGSVSVNKNCGCERWLRWPCDPWPPSPRSIQSRTMVDTCVLSVLALLLFTSVSGRDTERQKEARGAVKRSAPASCQQQPALPLACKDRCLPFSLSLPVCQSLPL